MKARRNATANWWPTPQQELLLRAALLRGQSATKAWEQWQAQIDLDRLDQGSFRLLPLLYHNLRAQGVEHPWLGKFKGLYRRTWYRNQMLFHHAALVLKHLHAAGVETLLLKGAALVPLFYRDFGLRPMGDFDLLVPMNKVAAAEHLLRQLGWTCGLRPGSLATCYQSFLYAAPFRDEAGREIDLHWHVLNRLFQTGDDAEFWANRVPVQIGDVDTAALNPADQLLHVCVHGASNSDVPQLRWVADALVILQVSPDVEWEYLVAQARRHRVVLALRETLGYLRRTVAPTIPLALLQELHSERISKAEQLTFQSLTSPLDEQGPLLLAWSFYQGYVKLLRDARGWRTLREVMLSLQQQRQIDHFWKVPFHIAFRWMRRMIFSFLVRKRARPTVRKM